MIAAEPPFAPEDLESRVRAFLQERWHQPPGTELTVRLSLPSPGPTGRHSLNRIFQLEVSSPGRPESRRLIAKYISAEDARGGDLAEFHMLERLYGNQAFEEEGFRVPEPLCHFPDLRVVLMEKVEGTGLDDLLGSLDPAGPLRNRPLIRLCGRMLRSCHDLNGVGTTDAIPSEVFGKIRDAAPDLSRWRALSASTVGSLMGLEDIVMPGGGVEGLAVVRQHGDFDLGNILQGEKGLTLIDFTFSSEEVIFNDLARFVASLDMHYFVHDYFAPRLLAMCRREFLAGYYGGENLWGPREEILVDLYKIRHKMIKFHADSRRFHIGGQRVSRQPRTIYHRRSLMRDLRALLSKCRGG